jgi:hypothetical protein
MRIALATFAFVAVLGAAVPSFAQESLDAQAAGGTQAKPAPPQKPRPPRPPRGFRVFGGAEVTMPGAKDAFDAVTGSPVFAAYGGGMELVNLWRGLFLRFQIVRGTKGAEHGLVVDGDFLPTGVPFDISMRTTELGAGWRFHFRKPGRSFHVGAGRTWIAYKERTAGFPEEDLDESHDGTFVMAGYTHPLTSRFSIVLEGLFRRVDAGEGTGIMAGFNESDLGGAGARVLVSYRLK